MYEINSDKELDGDFGTSYHDDDSNNYKEENIPRAKGQPIKKNINNKLSSPTVKETLLKETHTKETNEEDKD